MVIVGSEGLEEVQINLPQSTSLAFDVEHVTDEGAIIDHSGSTVRMAFQSKDKKTTYVLDSCCTCTADKIRVMIPASVSAGLPLGKLVWDMIVTTEFGEQVRLCYGDVRVIDTYAHDEA